MQKGTSKRVRLTGSLLPFQVIQTSEKQGSLLDVKGKCFHARKLNIYVHLPRQRQIYVSCVSHTQQTIKVNLLLTYKLKLSVPQRTILLESCLTMTASSQEYEMQTRAEGHCCLPPNHYHLLSLINHSSRFLFLFFYFFFLFCFWCFINVCTLHA